ncbi:MAG: hypothetical protein Q7R61_02095 [bacterium]|nr:hypothetical protein [bacterium]
MGKTNNKKIIGFDLDGVIINHAPAKIKLAKKLGFNLKPKETQSEIIKKIINKSDYLKFQQALYYDPKIFKETPLMTGAKAGLNAIKKSEMPFVLITRRRKTEETIAVLKHHGLWPKFFNEKNAFFVTEPEDKNIKARELGLTHYVDDETGVLEKLVDVKNLFLFDNLGVFSAIGGSAYGGKNTYGYTRVESWKELVEYFLI